MQERVFDRLFRAAEIANSTRQEVYEYEENLKVYRDWYNVIATAENKGIEKGHEEKRLDIARRMKEMHFPVEEIVKVTRWGMEEIAGL